MIVLSLSPHSTNFDIAVLAFWNLHSMYIEIYQKGPEGLTASLFWCIQKHLKRCLKWSWISAYFSRWWSSIRVYTGLQAALLGWTQVRRVWKQHSDFFKFNRSPRATAADGGKDTYLPRIRFDVPFVRCNLGSSQGFSRCSIQPPYGRHGSTDPEFYPMLSYPNGSNEMKILSSLSWWRDAGKESSRLPACLAVKWAQELHSKNVWYAAGHDPGTNVSESEPAFRGFS